MFVRGDIKLLEDALFKKISLYILHRLYILLDMLHRYKIIKS
jgi:hypothetical protein